MKYILSLLLLIGTSTDIDRIAKINKLKKEAKAAFESGDYQTAIDKYTYLLDSMKVEKHREQISLNLANAYYHSKDTTNALQSYQKATESAIKSIKSTAYQQQGLIEYQQKKHKEALGSFKNALKANPANEQARYNYEMLKKLIKEQEQKNKDKNKDNKDQKDKDKKDKQKDNKNQKDNKENKDKNKQDQNKKEQDKKDQQKKEDDKKKEEQKKGEKKEDKKEDKKPKKGEENNKDQQDNKQKKLPDGVEQKLKEMKISEEKAKMILEALKNQEVQYIQQNKKKATKRSNSDKPDW